MKRFLMVGDARRVVAAGTMLVLGLVMGVASSTAWGAGQAKLELISSAGGVTMGAPAGLAVNRSGAGGVAAGDFYVADRSNHRLAQFHKDGEFVAVFGRGVNQTTGGNICTAASGNVCKAGLGNASAGSNWNVLGVGVDQETGNVFAYASEGAAATTGGRVNVFSATGSFQGAFGWKVNGESPGEELQFCKALCQTGAANAGPGAFGRSSATTRTMTIDASGHLYVPDPGNLRINEYSVSLNGSNEVVGVTFVRSLGWNVNKVAPAEQLQTCTTATGCQKGSPGSGPGQFSAENPVSVAVDDAGSIYAVSAQRETLSCETPAAICRIQKFNADGSFGEVFGTAPDSCPTTIESGTGNSQQAMAVTVDPATQNVLVLKKVAPTKMQVCEFAGDGSLLDIFPSVPLDVSSALTLNAGIAVGADGLVYAADGAPGVYVLGPAPAPDADMVSVTEVGQTEARLNGVVTVPTYKAGGFPTLYQFELSSDLGFTWAKVPEPPGSAGATAGPVMVSNIASGLQPNVNYLVRLTATTGPSVTSESIQFKTASAPPSVAYAPGANELTDIVNPYGSTTAKLAGFVNPNNQLTTYRFDYGTTTAYGLQSPAEFEPSAGGGGTPLVVKANLSGLAPATVYHYRIVATNASGVTFGPDRQFETAEQRQVFNSCGLPDDRCLELVSPRDKGAVGRVGSAASGEDLQVQAAVGSGAIAYQIANGLSSTTAPNEVLYRSIRGAGGWSAAQLSPPLIEQNETKQPSALAGYTRALSADLSCGVVLSPFRLTGDTPTRVIEAGGTNLYRRDNQTGAYEVITKLPPTNAPAPDIQIPLGATEYQLVSVSPDCRRVVFNTPYLYPGVPSAPPDGAKRPVYEWVDGMLRGIGFVPGPSGEVAVPVTTGAPTSAISAVSETGRRVVFTATSQLGADQGKAAVFSRSGGTSTVDVSQSETATSTNGARFQAASSDGSKVFFTANYGIADESSSGPQNAACAESSDGSGCDLYEYDFSAPAGERLTDLSAHAAEPGGAAVAGVVAISSDGEYVYFAARGQLVAGAGPTFSENQANGTYSVYLSHAGTRSFVGNVKAQDLTGAAGVLMSTGVGVNANTGWAAHVTPDGRRLLFGSSANVTGFNPAGTIQAYLYSATADATVCISCRRDGGSPAPAGDLTLLPPMGLGKGLRPVLALTANGERAFFRSRDSLVSGAPEGEINLYEWRRGQIYLLSSSERLTYFGASADGTDVYFSSRERENWEDEDERTDLYVARSGGGFAQPVQPVPCNPLIENSCGVGSGSAPAAAVPPPSAIFTGPGNPPSEQGSKGNKKKNNKKKKQQRGKKRGQGKAGSGSKNRRAHGNRGTSK